MIDPARRDMRDEPGPVPAVLLVVLSVVLLVTSYLMSQAPQPTYSATESQAAFGTESCTSYLGTPYDCY